MSSILAAAQSSPAVAAAPTTTVLTIPDSYLPDVVVDGDDRAYVSNITHHRVEVVNLRTKTLEAPIAVAYPDSVDLSPDGRTLYVTSGAGALVAIDIALRTEVRRYEVGRAEDLAVTKDGTALFTIWDSGAVRIATRLLNLTTGAVRDFGKIGTSHPVGTYTGFVQASGDRSHVLLYGSALAMYDAATDSLGTPTTFGLAGTRAPGLDATGATVVADNPEGTLLLDGQLKPRATFLRDHTGNYPFDSVAVDAGGTRAYRVFGDKVDVLDLALARKIATLILPEALQQVDDVDSIALSADGETLVVPTRSSIMLAPVDGAVPLPPCTPDSPAPMVLRVCGQLVDVVVDANGHAYASNTVLNRVEVVSLATGALEASIPVGSQPRGLDLSPDGRLLYVANWGASDVSVVDTALRQELRRIPIPPASWNIYRDGPDAIAIAANGVALLTTSFHPKDGGWRFLQIDLASETVQPRADLFPQNTFAEGPEEMRASADRSVITGTNHFYDENPQVTRYSASTDSFGTPRVLSGPGAIAAAAGGSRVLAIPGATVFDADMAVQGTITGAGKAVAVNASGTTGYRVQDGSIDVLDLGGLLQVGSIPLPEAVGSAPGTVAITRDGAKLAVLTASGLSIVDASSAAITPKSAYAVWVQPTTAPALDAVGTWVIPANVPAAASGQLPPSYLYAHYFNFTQSPSALGVIGLVTSAGTKLAAFGVVDGAGKPHSVGLPFEWVANHAYYLFVAQLGPSTFGGWVYDNDAGAWTYLGGVDLPAPLGKIAPATVTQVIWFGATGATCRVFPTAEAYFHPAVGYAGGGVTLGTKAAFQAGAAGTCPATATTEVRPWIHLRLGANLA
jgi:YVTN family beta-propeller protein